MMRALLMLVALLIPGATARAFSDPSLYESAAERGGGAGRYFTGSPLDGHTCAVCHRGGAEPRIGMQGLPAEFEIGQTYEVAIHWAEPTEPHALQLELVSERGESPAVELVAADALPSSARCDSAADGEPAVYVTTVGARRVVGVRDCGASELRFRFTAPAAQRLAFAATVVRSDSSGTPEGDGVSEFRTVLYPRGRAPSSDGGCHVAGASAEGAGQACLLMLIALAWRRRRSADRVCSVALSLLLGCYEADQSVRLDDQADAGNTLPWTGSLLDASAPTPDAATGSRRLRVRVLTAPFVGRYAPRNIGAIWIEDEQGTYVKTLARWAAARAMYLRAHQAKSGGDLTDAVTSATLATHQVHEVGWNLTDRRGAPVPKGNYRLALELTDRDASGPLLYVPFTYDDAPLVLTPPGTAQFRDIELRLE